MISVCSELYLMVVDEQTGDLRVNQTSLAYGLGAAQLAELALDRCVTFGDGQLFLVSHHEAPDDPILRELYEVARQERHDLQAWLRFLARDAVPQVREHLVHVGVLRRVTRRTLIRRSVAVVPADANYAVYLAARLRLLISLHPWRATTADRVLCGLVLAVGLDRRGLDWDPHLRERAEVLAGELPPPLRELIGHTQAAVGAAAIRGL